MKEQEGMIVLWEEAQVPHLDVNEEGGGWAISGEAVNIEVDMLIALLDCRQHCSGGEGGGV